ncbi:LysR family transcriptional regulator [Microbulbifer sp. JMSA004]|uniref:LysR family transcriptional regulator n=1 Tax=unclassified Microbulbifer TaxID=2619833 RepID=UPI0024AD54FB|nr:LysR family transcriptional regulator [Microbulbifer sp. VAAF005]WHI48352.1 LysR family transcriptional regulator [Microbulbifer sp. VAAF005]
MRLRHIEVFHAVYNTGSISDAAKLLNVSQPSVSKVLSHAEMQLGFKLFLRVKGKLVSTSEAHSLIEEVRKIYQQISAIKKTAENLKEHTHGHIRVVCMPALGLNLLPDAIKHYHKKFPNVTFDVKTKHYDQAIESLYEYENDLALVFTDRDHPSIEAIEIGTGQLVHIAPADPASSEREQIKLSDIDKEGFISISNTGPLGDLLSQRFSAENIMPKTSIQAQTYYLAKNLVARGLGYSIFDEFTAAADNRGEVVCTPFNPPIEFKLKCFHHANQPLSKTAADFVEDIKKAFSALRAS